ncbi:glutamine amidotransferase-related protein [Chryseolinea lacunae]|uniref:CTP synthase (glutamine hydrolyzing) n=1 Tax=Chryseolinea lacunae TaxID=2801331 RepID=A0ABS1KS39_9BACT|nr:gamma-glutamyl-gamma-aminobutyrate hydrolase family protein [Chryseolinea lacunae]MBL0742254.1 gamma-glutamyl-gamma-aminobutyrate hydrolase family protein [Chryseolinea lacunae]
MKRIRVGLVGDFNEKIHTHLALNEAIDHCRPFLDFMLDAHWVNTATLDETIFEENKFHGLIIAPGSPYANDAGVYETIRHARENNFPLLGFCGGFQYMVIEYARNVLKIKDADHGETHPESSKLVVSKMSCSLKGQQEQVLIRDRDSWLYHVLKADTFTGHFYCSYGVNPAFQNKLNKPPFTFTAFSPDGEARAVELKGHRFFNGTLFQPSLASAPGHPNPLLVDFFWRCR